MAEYILSNIFTPGDCETIFNTGPSENKSRFDNKQYIYDVSIYMEIVNITNDLSKYLNFYISKGGEPTDSIYIEVLNFENELLNNYKTYFTDNYVWTNYHSEKICYYDRAEELNKMLNSTYFEYYLMVQQIERYNCCFLTTFRQLSDYYTYIFNTQNYFCSTDKVTKKLIDNLENEREHFLDDTDDLDDLEYYTKILNNIIDRKSYIYNDFDNYKYELQSIIEVQETLNFRIDQFLSDIKLTLKVVSLVNILFNMHSDDDDRGKNYSESIQNIFILDTNQTYMDYYTMKSLEITSMCPPKIIDTKKYLKPDMSNFKELIDLAASACFNTYGFSDHCSALNDLFISMGWDDSLIKKFSILETT